MNKTNILNSYTSRISIYIHICKKYIRMMEVYISQMNIVIQGSENTITINKV